MFFKELVRVYWTHGRHFYSKRLAVHSGYTVFSICACWELNPQHFVRFTQCSTTEPQEHHFSFFALSNLVTQTCLHFHMTGQLATSEHAKCTFFIYNLLLHLFASLRRIMYFDVAKFSIKLFSFVYFSVSVVRQRDEYKIVTETRPIKTTYPALPSKMLICTKILIYNRASSVKII